MNDKRSRDAVAIILGQSAAMLTPEQYQRVIEAWQSTIDYAPKSLALAWHAYRLGADKQAVMAADAAAERFPNHPVFAAEASFMHDLQHARQEQ